ncbi:MAG: FHA domain-containing protein, partial [Acidimicrobiales bacterium]
AGAVGGLVARAVGRLVAGAGTGALPPFGVVAPLEGGRVVLLHGAVWAHIAADHTELLSGRESVTWADRIVGDRSATVSIGSKEPPVVVDPRSDLRAGLVPGDGFVLTPAAVPAARPETPDAGHAGPETPDAGHAGPETLRPAASPPAARMPATTVAVELPAPEAGPEAPAAADQTAPQPLESVAAVAPPGAEVRPGRPAARSTEVVSGPLGWLVAGDGMRIPLDRYYVLGREPDQDPTVTSGSATPVRLEDQDNLISRVHSYVAVEAGEVLVWDASSANGTYVAAPGAEDWTRVGHEPVAIQPEWSVRLGRHLLTFELAPAGQ